MCYSPDLLEARSVELRYHNTDLTRVVIGVCNVEKVTTWGRRHDVISEYYHIWTRREGNERPESTLNGR